MKWGRVILVIFGALVITALGIDAADTLQGSKGTLLSQVISSRDSGGGCPAGMTLVENLATVTCIDTYEASPGKECPVPVPEQMLGTQRNMQARNCNAESKEGALPWSFITRDQAMQMCARAGKRLPTSDEWYALALGMVDVENSCNVSSKSVSASGSHESCASPAGAYDLVGNVWEWVSDDIINGSYKSFSLPSSGYVAQVDAGGIATVVSEEAQDLFGKDYFWSRADGAYGVIRGGYYDSGEDAGLYTVNASVPTSFATQGIGFRCVEDVL
jgi:formylglycine-generating enzyme required for sulfatase activity